MRIATIVILLSILTLPACERPPEPPPIAVVTGTTQVTPPSPPALGADQAVCRILEPEPAIRNSGFDSFAAEVRFGGPGKLEFFWGDRSVPGEQTSPHYVMASSIIELDPVRIEFAWKIVPGREVLTKYVEPLGGPEGLIALREAVPGIDDARLALFRMITSTKNGRSSTDGHLSMRSTPPQNASSHTMSPSVGEEMSLPPGEHVIVWQRVWSDTSGVSTASRLGSERPRIVVDGNEVPLPEHPLPVWSLSLRFTPR